MYRILVAAALLIAGASAASAQGYGSRHYGYGYHRPGPVVVLPHRPWLVPPHRRGWYGHNRFRRHHGWNRHW